MAINFDNALGIHEQALLLRNKRTEILANNLVNADTPGFKARDINFESELARVVESRQMPRINTSHSKHLGGAAPVTDRVTLSYRIPAQDTLDGNTVDEQLENAAFARNAVAHQASFEFLNGKVKGLMKAIRGE